MRPQPTALLLPKLPFRCATLYGSLGSKRSAGDVGVILVSGSFSCCRFWPKAIPIKVLRFLLNTIGMLSDDWVVISAVLTFVTL